MFIESPRSKGNRRKASLRAKAARTFLNDEKNGRKNSSTLFDSLTNEFKYENSAENKPNVGSTHNSPILCKSTRFELINDIDKFVREEREKEKIERDRREENIHKVKKGLQKKLKREDKQKQEIDDNKNKNEIKNEDENANLKNLQIISIDQIQGEEEKTKNKFKHSSMNRMSDISKRRSDPFIFPNIKLLNAGQSSER